jgi:hypothetical protein
MIGHILSYLQLCDFLALNEGATSFGGTSLLIPKKTAEKVQISIIKKQKGFFPELKSFDSHRT